MTTEYSYHYNTMTPSGEGCAVRREADDALVAGGLHHLHAVDLVEVLDRAPTPIPLCSACDRPAVRYLLTGGNGHRRRAWVHCAAHGPQALALWRSCGVPATLGRLRTADAGGDRDAHQH